MPFFVKRNGQAVPIVSDPNVINDTTASQNTAYSGSKVDSLIANKIDALTPKVYSLFIAKTDWDETGTVEIDVPGTFGYNIPSENYNQLVLSDEQTDHWRRFNVCLDHAHDASGYITTIEFSCDPGNIPDRPIYFNIVSSKSEYVDWSVIGNLIVPPGLQVDTSFDSDSTNPVQNKVVKAALDGKATPADIAALINDTTASQNTAYSGSKVNNLIANHTHASSQINAMTGYSKPSSTSSISPADSLNTAIGKVEKGLEGKQSPLSLGQYSGLGREIQVMDNEEVGQTWYNTGVVDIEPSSSEGKLTVSKVDDSTFPGSAPYTSEDIDIPGWEKVENSPITTTATGTDLTLSTAAGDINALTVYGKSEVIDGVIKSAGEGGSIEIETCQKNLFDPTVYSEYLQQDGTYKINPSTLDSIRISVKAYIGKTLTFSAYLSKSGNYPTYMRVMAIINGMPISGTTVNVESYTRSTLTITPETKEDEIYISYGSLGNAEYMYFKDIQLEFGSTATAYEPYNGTMATFTTGTPLRGIPDTTVRDVMTWDGTSGEVTKNCGDVLVTTLLWQKGNRNNDDTGFNYFAYLGANYYMKPFTHFILPSYTSIIYDSSGWENIAVNTGFIIPSYIVICSASNDTTELATELANKHIVYELATPTTQALTSTENASLAALRTFAPQTHAQNNAGADMTVEAYAGTENGKAVNELKQDVQSEISALKITQSATLTLTVAGWSNNAQTVSYAHDTAKRNVIDVDTSSIEEWANCSILATAETTSGITFSCKTVPENALTFRVTSMGVN